jgi:type VI secretion system protein ImpJ
MKLLNRVLWREGMHLSQHHFQTQSRYVEDTIAAALDQLAPGSFGLTHLVLDDEAVRNGVAVLRSARGIMSDSLPFQMPESDPLPAPKQFAAVFSPTQHAHELHLVLKQYASGGANVGADGGAFRYRREARHVADAVTGADEASVDLALREFRLVLDIEVKPDDVDLPIARIVRDGAGRFGYDTDFIPPCTKLSGSLRLLQLLRQIIEKLESKNDALVSELKGAGNLANYAAHEVSGFWVLHTIRSSLARLRHHAFSRESQPERLYLDLARLAGELSTFTLHSAPGDVPPYDHRRPTDCFVLLTRLIIGNLEAIVRTSGGRYTLELDEPNYYSAAVPDERFYRNAAWILGLQPARMDSAQVARAPELLKVCSRRDLPRLVREGRAVTLTLLPLSVTPAAISPQPGMVYFALRLDGPCWRAITARRELGVYVPDMLPLTRLELHVIPTG